MKKITPYSIIGLCILFFSCSGDSAGPVNKISYKVNGGKQRINNTFVFENNGVVLIGAGYREFDIPDEMLEFKVNVTDGADHHVTDVQYGNASGFFFDFDPCISTVTVNPEKRTITGTLSGNLKHESTSTTSLPITEGTFSVHY